MCYNNSQKAKIKELAKRYGKNIDIIEAWKRIIEERKANGENVSNYTEEANRIATFGAPMCSVVTDDTEIQVMQWGLIPAMTKDLKERDKYIKDNWFRNAEAEKIFKTWPYRYLIESKRCIFPSTGYYEYHHNPDKTITLYYIFLKDEPIFSMGGIWDIRENPVTKEQLHSFSLITTAANKLTAEIHNEGQFKHRIPLILNKEAEEKWVDPSLNKDDIKSLLKVYGDENMDAYPMSKDFSHRIALPKDIQRKLEF